MQYLSQIVYLGFILMLAFVLLPKIRIKGQTIINTKIIVNEALKRSINFRHLRILLLFCLLSIIITLATPFIHALAQSSNSLSIVDIDSISALLIGTVLLLISIYHALRNRA